MPGRRAAFVLALLAVGASPASAYERQDPFTLEVGLGYVGSAHTEPGSLLYEGALGGRVLAFGPYADAFQGGVGLAGDTSGRLTGLVGVRLLSGFDEWQTRLDAQLAVDAFPDVAVGLRAAFGGGWLVAPGWRVGAELAAVFLAINTRFGFEASAVVLYNW